MSFKTIYADPPWNERGGGVIQRDAAAPPSEVFDSQAHADAAWSVTCQEYAARLDAEASQQAAAAHANALRRSFGTKPARPLRPARQDDLFEPIEQRRLF